jgi:hypothetical protein
VQWTFSRCLLPQHTLCHSLRCVWTMSSVSCTMSLQRGHGVGQNGVGCSTSFRLCGSSGGGGGGGRDELLSGDPAAASVSGDPAASVATSVLTSVGEAQGVGDRSSSVGTSVRTSEGTSVGTSVRSGASDSTSECVGEAQAMGAAVMASPLEEPPSPHTPSSAPTPMEVTPKWAANAATIFRLFLGERSCRAATAAVFRFSVQPCPLPALSMRSSAAAFICGPRRRRGARLSATAEPPI